MPSPRSEQKLRNGFTLIELSIVLVIIGLVIGGVLVGRDLLDAAAVRAQISQIEKYHAAVNTFRVKYGYLPGDIPDPYASQFGFQARGAFGGQGDGNGLLQGVMDNTGWYCDNCIFAGETAMFWVDLSAANLIEGGFSTANPLAPPASVSSAEVANYFPAAKIGGNNFVYVWSGGWDALSPFKMDEFNYFGLSTIYGSYTGFPGVAAANSALTVQQAANIDRKIDDGLPQFGRVLAMYDFPLVWAAGGTVADPGVGQTNAGTWDPATYGPVVSGDFRSTPASATTCYDNAGVPGGTEHYSTQVNNGQNINCALSFQFQ